MEMTNTVHVSAGAVKLIATPDDAGAWHVTAEIVSRSHTWSMDEVTELHSEMQKMYDMCTAMTAAKPKPRAAPKQPEVTE